MKITTSLKLLVWFNLILGLCLWFLYCTDYSLAGTVADIVFPPAVAGVALVSMAMVKRRRIFPRLFVTLAHLPSIIGGGLYVLAGFMLLVPPFTLAGLFTLSEVGGETLIDQAVSPDGAQVASVYFRPVGAYSGGSGRIFVRVSPRLLPLIERDVYYLRVSSADENTIDYLKWVDNQTIYIPERQQTVEVGHVQFQMPVVFALPISIVRYSSAQSEARQQEAELTKPLKDVPIYPGQIEHPSTFYVRVYQTAERVYFAPGSKLDDVTVWHQSALPAAGWRISEVEELSTSEGASRHEYCIQAQKTESDQTRFYYWEITEVMGEGRSWQVRVDVTTPNPVAGACYHHRP